MILHVHVLGLIQSIDLLFPTLHVPLVHVTIEGLLGEIDQGLEDTDPPTDLLEGNTEDKIQLDVNTGEEIDLDLVLSQIKIIHQVLQIAIPPPQTPQTGVLLEILIGEIGKALPQLKRVVSPLTEIPTSTSIRRDILTLERRPAKEFVGETL